MKKKIIPFLCLLAAASLVSCGNDTTSSVTPEASSEETVTSSVEDSTPESVAESSEAVEDSSEAPANTFTISASDDTNRVMPDYEVNGNTYTFYLSANKSACVLEGELNGNIVVSGERLLASEEAGNIAFELHGVTITCDTAAPIYYNCEEKKVVLDVKKETVNTISYTGADEEAAVESVNNIEIKGKGTINFSSTSGHAIKSDELLLSSSTTINIENTGKDGIHVKELILSEDDDNFAGKISLKGVTKQAISVADYDSETGIADGSIIWSNEAFEITIDGAKNVFNLDNSTTIPVTATITATNISEDFAAKEKKSLTVTVTIADGANVSYNGTVLTGEIAL